MVIYGLRAAHLHTKVCNYLYANYRIIETKSGFKHWPLKQKALHHTLKGFSPAPQTGNNSNHLVEQLKVLNYLQVV